MTAQISCIVAATISWVWWPLFVVSAPLVAVLQTAWCCKMKKAGILSACVLSFLAFVGSLSIGIWMTQKCGWRIFTPLLNYDGDDYTYTYTPPPPGMDDEYYNNYPYYEYEPHCYDYMNNPTAWVVVTFVDCFLFLLTFLSATFFLLARYDGKAAKWAQAQKEADEDEVVVPVVEMGVIPSSTPPEARATLLDTPDEKNLNSA
jgi:hypothetical protein